MNKVGLISQVAEEADITKKEAAKIVEVVFNTISAELAIGNSVQLVGFGNFTVKDRAARKGRNPQDGSEIDIPATKAPTFKAGKNLKEIVK